MDTPNHNEDYATSRQKDNNSSNDHDDDEDSCKDDKDLEFLLTCNEELPAASSPLIAANQSTKVEQPRIDDDSTDAVDAAAAANPSPPSLTDPSIPTPTVTEPSIVPTILESVIPTVLKPKSPTATISTVQDLSIPLHRLIMRKELNDLNDTKLNSVSSASNSDNNDSDICDDGLDQIVAASNIKARTSDTKTQSNKQQLLKSCSPKKQPISKKQLQLPNTKKNTNTNTNTNTIRNHTQQVPKRKNNLPLNKHQEEPTIHHNLASFPSWTANKLTNNSQYICSKWDELKLGEEAGTGQLNRYLNAVQDLNTSKARDRMSKITPRQVLQIMETLRPVTCQPPINSELHNLVRIGGDDLLRQLTDIGDDELICDVEYDERDVIDNDEEGVEVNVDINNVDQAKSSTSTNVPAAVVTEILPDKLSQSNERIDQNGPSSPLPISLPLPLQLPLQLSSIHAEDTTSRTSIKQDEKEATSSQKDIIKEPEEETTFKKIKLPWKSLINVYELMCNQDSYYAAKTPLQRRKTHYMEHPDVIEKLRSIENKACELKLRSEVMKRKQEELGLLFDNNRHQKKQYVKNKK